MTRFTLVAVGLAILTCVIVCTILTIGEARATPDRNGDGSLSGYVYDNGSQPLGSVLIRIQCSGLYNETFTDDFGYYEITDVPIVECLWTVTTTKQGYRHSSLERTIDEGSTQDFTLESVRIWYVDDDAGEGGNGSSDSPFNKIQDAVDACMFGDIIRVFDGTYHENLIIDKSLSLHGSGPNGTVIQGVGEGAAVQILAGGVTVHGLNISATDPDTALIITRADGCTVSNNILRDTHNGILVDGSVRNNILGNEFRNTGHALQLFDSNSNRIENNVFENISGYGIYNSRSNYNVISGSTFFGNGIGIGLGSETHHNRIRNNSFDSHATTAISLLRSSSNEIEGNRISHNDIGISVGSKSNLNLITGNTITHNRIGIQNRYNSHVTTMQNNSISGNSEFGLEVVPPNEVIIDARYNWWGSPFGPYHPSLNPDGKGDNVTDEILFDPWLLVREGDSTVILSGYVFDWLDDPIEGALVRLDCGFVMTAYTDDSGFYMIENIPILECTWNVTASRSGMQDSWVKITIEGNTTQYLQLKADDTHYVDDDAPDGGNGRLWSPFDEVQDAIDISEDGDTIHVFAGTYRENIVVHKRVTIIGNGSEDTVIVGEFGPSVVEITAEDTRISDLGIIWDNYLFNLDGIEIRSSGNLITNSRFSNSDHGISIVNGPSHNRIIGCTFSNNMNGIQLWGVSDNLISNNIFTDNDISVSSGYSSNLTLTENTMIGGGLLVYGHLVEHWVTHDIETSNTLQGSPITYYANTTGRIAPSDYGQIILANCSDMNLEDLVFDEKPHAIQIGFSTRIVIHNNSISHSKYTGIIGYLSNNITISNNICTNSSGIYLWRSDHNLVINNTCSASNDGINLIESQNNTIIGNTCESNYFGIALFEYSVNNFVSRNSLKDNRVGLYYGRQSELNEIRNNSFLGNTHWAVHDGLNNGNIIDARFNYWGHLSGPYNETTNPKGLGDNITDLILFEPWYDGDWNLMYIPEEEDPEDDPNHAYFSFMLLVLLCLLITLVIVVKTPGTRFQREQGQNGKEPSSQDSSHDASNGQDQSNRITTCEHCQESFDISPTEKALRVPCPHCGMYTLK